MLTAARFAGRELRHGVHGFGVFLACLALGVAAIAAAGAAGETFSRGVRAEMAAIYGGDIEVEANRRALPEAARAALAELGTVNEIVSAAVTADASGVREVVNLRAVSERHPLVGAAVLDGAPDFQTALENEREGDRTVFGAVLSPEAAARLRLEIGERFSVNGAEFHVRAIARDEPDDAGLGFSFAPRITVPLEAVSEAGLTGDRALYTSRYKILLPDGADLDAAQAAASEIAGPDWEVGNRTEAADAFGDLLERLAQFLAVAGFAALICGGVGVNQAVTAFLAERVSSIAIMKSLGGGQSLAATTYLLQIGALAMLGSAAGAGLGIMAPPLALSVFGDALPLPAESGVYWKEGAKAAAFGLVGAAVFASPPIGRARATKPGALLAAGARASDHTPWAERIATLAAVITFLGLAAGTSPAPVLTAGLVAAAAGAFVLFAALGWAIKRAARPVRRFTRGRLRLGVSNLAGPASIAPIAAPALGLGLALLALTSLVQSNLVRQLAEIAPAELPSLLVIRLPGDAVETLDQLAEEYGVDITDAEAYLRAPVLFARVDAVNGTPIDEINVDPREEWFVNGETAVSIAGPKPDDAVLEAGEWWPTTYDGPPLVSLEADAARGARMAIGDTVTFRILGRAIDAQVANYRTVDWGGFGGNFAVIFAPGTLEAANPDYSAILRVPETVQPALTEAARDAIPGALFIDVRARLADAAGVVRRAISAVSLVSTVVIAAGALVMFGAFAAAARRRESESALLKTLGLGPAAVLALYAGEFAVTGAIAAALALGVAAAGSYPIIVEVFEARWAPDWRLALSAAGLAVVFAAAGGLVAGALSLRAPPMRALRQG